MPIIHNSRKTELVNIIKATSKIILKLGKRYNR